MQSEQIDKLAEALAKAQATIKNATINKINPHFKSKYADLAAVFDAIRKPLSDNGLAVTQTTEIREGAMALVTTLAHSSGQWIKSDYPLPVTGRPQEIGSALTYARRYSLSAIAGIAADEDDDGEGAERDRQKIDASKVTPRKVEAPVSPDGEVSPHAIGFNGNAIEWGGKYIAALKSAASSDELTQWAMENADTLNKIAESAPKAHKSCVAAAKAQLDALTPKLEAAE
jgi:hypothetical protein